MSNPQPGIDPLGDWLMRWCWFSPPRDLAERTRRRVAVHLLPVLFFLYILAYLDRSNVAVAKLGMTLPPEKGGLGFSEQVIGVGAGVFFWGYWLLEIPSTLSVIRWGARWVFCRILVLWGLCATVMGLIGLPVMHSWFAWMPTISESSGLFNTWGLSTAARLWNGLAAGDAEYQFYFWRFMLGFFEGGFFPSVIVYLTLWFRGQDRAKAIAVFMAAIPLSFVFGSPASGLIKEYVQWLGLPGWRWVYIIEGVLPVITGFAVLFCLPDRPEKVSWLADDERQWLSGELVAEAAAKKGHGHFEWIHHLGMVLLLTAFYFCQNVMSYGLTNFLPTILKLQADIQDDKIATFLTAGIAAISLVGMLVNGWHSDHTHERIWHVAVPIAMAGVGLLLAGFTYDSPAINLAVIALFIGPFLYMHLPAFWPIPSMFLGATAAASAIGFINMMGNLGGHFGPSWVGKAADMAKNADGTPRFDQALKILGPWGLAGAAIILIGAWWTSQTRRRREARLANPAQ